MPTNINSLENNSQEHGKYVRTSSATNLIVTSPSAREIEDLWPYSTYPVNVSTTGDTLSFATLGDKISTKTIILNGQEIEVSKLLKAYTTMNNRLDKIEANQKKIQELLERAIEAGTVPNLQETLR